MPKTNFRPEIHGFAFVNYWTFDDTEAKRIRDGLTAAIDDALVLPDFISGGLVKVLGVDRKLADQVANSLPQVYGLCGGMAYAALDYYKAGQPTPRGRGPRDWPTHATPEGGLLRDYLSKRLLDSLSTGGAGAITIGWMVMQHEVPATWPFRGGAPWLLARSREQWPILKKHIDAGEPWPIVLVGESKQAMDNHQVLAYGYDDPGDGTGTIYVYDMNSPGNCPAKVDQTVEQTIRLNFNATLLGTVESCPGSHSPLRGFACSTYAPAHPPDIVMP